MIIKRELFSQKSGNKSLFINDFFEPYFNGGMGLLFANSLTKFDDSEKKRLL